MKKAAKKTAKKPWSANVTGYRSDSGNLPAINVKVYGGIVAEPSLERELDNRDDADAIRQDAYDMAQEAWWREAADVAHEILGSNAEVRPEGRSGGWLVVDNIGAPEDWGRTGVARWQRFEKRILRMMKRTELSSRYSEQAGNLLMEQEPYRSLADE